jgi:hypothetical protein
MLPSMKFQNGTQIQDGRLKVFIDSSVLKIFSNFFKINLASLKIQNGLYGRFFAQKFMIFWLRNRRMK